MARILAVVWVLAMWPFHRHQPAPAPIPRVVHIEESPCAINLELPDDMAFSYDGGDGAVGFGTSCQKAYDNWKNTPAPPWEWKV